MPIIEQGADGDADVEFAGGVEADGFPFRDGKHAGRDPGKYGAGGDLKDSERAV